MRGWKKGDPSFDRQALHSCVWIRSLSRQYPQPFPRGWPLYTAQIHTFAQTCRCCQLESPQLLFHTSPAGRSPNTSSTALLSPFSNRILLPKGPYSILLPAAESHLAAMAMYSQNSATAMAPPQKPETFMLSDSAQQNLPQDAQVALQQVDNRKSSSIASLLFNTSSSPLRFASRKVLPAIRDTS